MTDGGPVAFMAVRNEADVLPWTLRHLAEQGVSVYVLDDSSTDGSDQIAAAAANVIAVERFPKFDRGRYEWSEILSHIADVSKRFRPARWRILNDADEFMVSPRIGETLAEAFDRIAREGANAARFRVYQFALTDNDWTGATDPVRHFQFYDPASIESGLEHVRAWRVGGLVDLAATGGHEARFMNRRIAAEVFQLKHYPLRSIDQARRKILIDRIPRYAPSERAKRWHVQYDDLSVTHQWIRPMTGLKRWNHGGRKETV